MSGTRLWGAGRDALGSSTLPGPPSSLFQLCLFLWLFPPRLQGADKQGTWGGMVTLYPLGDEASTAEG